MSKIINLCCFLGFLRRVQKLANAYENNKARSITLWAPIDTTSATVIEAIQSRLSEPVAKVVLGVERDTRVRSTAKINIITTTDAAANHLLTNGIRIGTKILYPRTTRPRPSPNKERLPTQLLCRGHRGSFGRGSGGERNHHPKDRTTAPQKHQHQDRRLVNMDRPGFPDTLHFDGEEYAILWRNKKTTVTNRPTASNTGRSAERPIAAKRPDINTVDIVVGEAAEAEREEDPAPQPATTNMTGDEEMKVVESVSAKRRRRRQGKKALCGPIRFCRIP